MDKNNTSLNKEDYIHKIFVSEHKDLRSIYQSTPIEMQHMQLRPYEASMICMLLKIQGATKVLEIGTLHGYSAAWIAKTVSGIQKIYTIEKSLLHYNKAKENFIQYDLADKIEIINGDAADILPKLSSIAPFDAIFLDGNKNAYKLYYDYAVKYLKKGGLLIVDNIFLFGFIEENEAFIAPKYKKMLKNMQEFNNLLSKSNYFDTIALPSRDGIAISIKR